MSMRECSTLSCRPSVSNFKYFHLAFNKIAVTLKFLTLLSKSHFKAIDYSLLDHLCNHENLAFISKYFNHSLYTSQLKMSIAICG